MSVDETLVLKSRRGEIHHRRSLETSRFSIAAPIRFVTAFNDFTNHTDFSSAIIRINLRLIEMSIRLFLRSQARAFFERFGNISIGQHDWGSGQFAGQHDTGGK